MSTTHSSAALRTIPSTPHTATGPSGAGWPLPAPPRPGVDPSDPIWTIDHVAAALHLSVDRARECSRYSPAFPAPRAGFGRNLWSRQAVLDWFHALPEAPARRATTGTLVRTGAGGAAPTAVVPRPSGRPAQTRRTYAPRGTR